MNVRRNCLSVMLAVATCAAARGGESAGVPFAVPVGVPVAVVQRPTLFYGVSHYAPPPPTTTPESMPTPPSPTPEGELRQRVEALLIRRCAECHHAAQPDGGVALFDADGKPLAKLPRQLLVEATTPQIGEPAAMPPGERVRLTTEEWSLLKQWARMPASFVY